MPDTLHAKQAQRIARARDLSRMTADPLVAATLVTLANDLSECGEQARGALRFVPLSSPASAYLRTIMRLCGLDPEERR